MVVSNLDFYKSLVRYKSKFFLVFIFSFGIMAPLFSQVKDSVAQTDILEFLFKKKAAKIAAKNKKKKVNISLFPAFGTTPATGLAGVVAANFAFCTGKEETTHLSSISASAAYTSKQQFVLPIRSYIWLKNNSWSLPSDFRFMKYPQSTYGLGAKSDKENEVLVDYLYLRIYQQALKSIGSNFYAGGGVFCDQFWQIEQEDWNKPYASEFEDYNYGTNSRAYAGGVGVNFTYDDRANPINPGKASYASVLYRVNPGFLGNEQSWESVYADFRKYIFVPGKMQKNILGFWLLYWGVTGGTSPYLLLPSNGWDNHTSSGRGYEQGRFRGKHMISIETEYRYRISRNGLLGGVVFTNATTFPEKSGRIETVNPAIGAGLRIKLNKTSNTNLIIDFALGLNNNKGFYLDVGEIF